MKPVKNILIVDDDPIILDAYATILRSMGYQVATARDGQEGLQQAGQVEPDLILLDILMPVMDGLDFLRQFDPAAHPHTKILVLSNSSSGPHLTKAMELGALKYIMKTDLKPIEFKAEISRILKLNPTPF